MRYVYKITSPSGKYYIGQATISEHKKKQSYKFAAGRSGPPPGLIKPIHYKCYKEIWLGKYGV